MADWIDTPEQLDAVLATASTVYALDTEFVREKTFWPVLALIQLGFADTSGAEPRVYLVDPLIEGIPALLRQFFERDDLTCVVHSPSEDWVALRESIGAIPQHAFDTQTASAMLGKGHGLSYLRTVEMFTGIQLEKGETRSNWLARPLSESQQKYAADDVLHLHAIYAALRSELTANGRLAWFDEDMQRSLEAAREDTPETWPHLGMRAAGDIDMEQQKVLLRLFRWRDQHARQANLPRAWILSNDLALLIAREQPSTAGDLNRVMNKIPRSPYKLAKPILEALLTPLEEEASMPDARNIERRDKDRVRALQKSIQKLTEDLGLSDGVLASRRLVEQWVDHQEWTGALAGWRRAILEPVFTASNDATADPAPG